MNKTRDEIASESFGQPTKDNDADGGMNANVTSHGHNTLVQRSSTPQAGSGGIQLPSFRRFLKSTFNNFPLATQSGREHSMIGQHHPSDRRNLNFRHGLSTPGSSIGLVPWRQSTPLSSVFTPQSSSLASSSEPLITTTTTTTHSAEYFAPSDRSVPTSILEQQSKETLCRPTPEVDPVVTFPPQSTENKLHHDEQNTRAWLYVYHIAYDRSHGPILQIQCLDTSASGEVGVHCPFVMEACEIIAGNPGDTIVYSFPGTTPVSFSEGLLPPGDYLLQRPGYGTSGVHTAFPIISHFAVWRFHAPIPQRWQIISNMCKSKRPPVGKSKMSSEVTARDLCCRITKATYSLNNAYIVPQHEKNWFLGNTMYIFNFNRQILGMDDIGNGLTLRADLHQLWDKSSVFTIVPKNGALVCHFLIHQQEASQFHHNSQLHTTEAISPEFLYARFARSILGLSRQWLDRSKNLAIYVPTEGNITKLESKVVNGSSFLISLKHKASDARVQDVGRSDADTTESDNQVQEVENDNAPSNPTELVQHETTMAYAESVSINKALLKDIAVTEKDLALFTRSDACFENALPHLLRPDNKKCAQHGHHSDYYRIGGYLGVDLMNKVKGEWQARDKQLYIQKHQYRLPAPFLKDFSFEGFNPKLSTSQNWDQDDEMEEDMHEEE